MQLLLIADAWLLFRSFFIRVQKCTYIEFGNYSLRPRRPPFFLVESLGMGVQSSILPIFMPARAKARSADWAPGPGVLVLFPPVARSLMCRAVIPRTLIFSATS